MNSHQAHRPVFFSLTASLASFPFALQIQCLHQNLEEAKSRYSVQLSQLQLTINTLEVELQQLRASLEHQKSEYNLLLDIKMRLEMEIAEYRRLLDGGLYERRETEQKK